MNTRNRLRRIEQRAGDQQPQNFDLTYWHDNRDGTYTEGLPDKPSIPGDHTISHAELKALGGIVVLYTDKPPEDMSPLAVLRLPIEEL